MAQQMPRAAAEAAFIERLALALDAAVRVDEALIGANDAAGSACCFGSLQELDAAASPIGYEHLETISVCRQVVLGGRNKYLINGHTAQATQVQNFFQSVQLSEDRPAQAHLHGRRKARRHRARESVAEGAERGGGGGDDARARRPAPR